MLATIALSAIAIFALTALLINIGERKQEARNPYYRVVDLNDTISNPAVWGKNFPMQYDLYLRTVDMQRTKYGGSEAEPHSPTQADPRSVVAQSKLEEDPRLKTMWAGYAFSKDYRERRGHAYMLDDQTFTERQQFNPPGAWLNCHASMVTVYNNLGNRDIFKGFDAVNHMKYVEARQYAKHPVACIDCHDPQSMQLRVTRPAFILGIAMLGRACPLLVRLALVDVLGCKYEVGRTSDRLFAVDKKQLFGTQIPFLNHSRGIRKDDRKSGHTLHQLPETLFAHTR